MAWKRRKFLEKEQMTSSSLIAPGQAQQQNSLHFSRVKGTLSFVTP